MQYNFYKNEYSSIFLLICLTKSKIIRYILYEIRVAIVNTLYLHA